MSSRDDAVLCFFFQAEDGIRDLVRSRGLGDVYKRQMPMFASAGCVPGRNQPGASVRLSLALAAWLTYKSCLLYTSDAADERSSVDLGGRRIIKKKKNSN